MSKILIISYFFPPCPLTPSERIYSWARYFKEYGHEPIIVTRNWDRKVSGYHDMNRRSGTEEITEENEQYKVYYLPYSPGLAERIDILSQKVKNKWILRAVLLFYYIVVGFIEPPLLLISSPFYRKLYRFSAALLKQEPDISACLISGGPFMQFKIGYLLKKKFPNIKVVADYRDGWTTGHVNNPKNVKLVNLIYNNQSRYERKWLQSYAFFISVSSHLVKEIKKLINKDGITVENGYIKNNYNQIIVSDTNQSELIFSYTGYIYDTQPIEIFINGFKRYITDYPEKAIKIRFIGIMNQPAQVERITNLIKGIENYFDLLPRISKTECIKIQEQSDVFILVGHKGVKGTPGSKLYEFLALEKPVLVCPSDGDIVEERLTKSGQGIFANTEEDAYTVISQLVDKKANGQSLFTTPINKEYIKQFDRKNLSKKIIDAINEYHG